MDNSVSGSLDSANGTCKSRPIICCLLDPCMYQLYSDFVAYSPWFDFTFAFKIIFFHCTKPPLYNQNRIKRFDH